MRTHTNWQFSGFFPRIFLPPLLLLILGILPACNSDDKNDDADTLYAPPTDVAINSFKLKSNVNVLRALDSVYFSIDLNKAIVFNADSLPKGTDVTRLVPNITYSEYITSAVIEMTGGKVRTGTVDYKRQPGDSIDFSGRVTITLTSSSGNSRAYELKVNVHQTEPDSLCWGSAARSTLPSRLPSPEAQRTVRQGEKVVCLIEEADGSFTLATATDLDAGAPWERHRLTLPFTPRLRTLSATADALYILDDKDNLHTSADGSAWSAVSSSWKNILGAYDSELLGLKKTSDGYAITSLSGVYPDVALTGQLAGFPIQDYTDLYCYRSKWMSAPVAVIACGVTSQGELSDKVWGFDGNSWILLSQGEIPALQGATLVPYHTYVKPSGKVEYSEYSTLMLMGGIDERGEFNRKLYLSYNNGIDFRQSTGLMDMPSFIPGMWRLDNVVASKPMQADIVPAGWDKMPETALSPWYRVSTTLDGTTLRWECPYIYLFGGCDARGVLYNSIYRGVINRLTFCPII